MGSSNMQDGRCQSSHCPCLQLVWRCSALRGCGSLAYDTLCARSQDLKSGAQAQRLYTAVLVANGHHWDPAWPELPGSFSGGVLHSHEYRSPAAMVGKRVCVIGAGNSGARSPCPSLHSRAAMRAVWFLSQALQPSWR